MLYIFMCASLSIYLKKTKYKHTLGLYIFIGSFVFNVSYIYVFYGRKWIITAIYNTILLWVLAFVNFILFYKKKHMAGYLLIPYIVWLTFIVYMHIYVMIKNPNEVELRRRDKINSKD